MTIAPAWDRKGRPPATQEQLRFRLTLAIAALLGLALLGVKLVSAILDALSFPFGGPWT